MRNYDDYDDENIRLYTPILQRVIILAAVVIAVPVMMWTITTFVRSYVARPAVPALEHLASTNLPTRIPAPSPAPSGPARSAADQSALQQVNRASASDATSPLPATRNGLSHLASLPDTNAAPAVATPSSAIPAAATTTGDISIGSSTAPPAPPTPRPLAAALASRSNDSVVSTGTPSSSDRGIVWPNPNTTSPPDFASPRLPPPPAPARTAAVEALPAQEPIRGPIPMPRQRPGTFAMAATASGPVPLPRARPGAAPAETANTVIEPDYGYRPGLGSDR
jgi:hypothetical protein